jgi:hypothetical protein
MDLLLSPGGAGRVVCGGVEHIFPLGVIFKVIFVLLTLLLVSAVLDIFFCLSNAKCESIKENGCEYMVSYWLRKRLFHSICFPQMMIRTQLQSEGRGTPSFRCTSPHHFHHCISQLKMSFHAHIKKDFLLLLISTLNFFTSLAMLIDDEHNKSLVRNKYSWREKLEI